MSSHSISHFSIYPNPSFSRNTNINWQDSQTGGNVPHLKNLSMTTGDKTDQGAWHDGIT
jgi:hypothetical protein